MNIYTHDCRAAAARLRDPAELSKLSLARPCYWYSPRPRNRQGMNEVHVSHFRAYVPK